MGDPAGYPQDQFDLLVREADFFLEVVPERYGIDGVVDTPPLLAHGPGASSRRNETTVGMLQRCPS
tara:strand:- start:12 stop:209 length:198 start_codon:yes stop_codon:yes gene_type:complete